MKLNSFMIQAKNSQGFTLIELLVVIAIIGLLSSVVLASLNSARGKAYDASRKAELIQLQEAVESYYADNGYYPQSCGGYSNWGGAIGTGSGTTNCPTTYISGIGSYIPSLPVDSYPEWYTGGGTGYIYISNGTDYKIMDWVHTSQAYPQGTPMARCPSSCSPSTYSYCADTNDQYDLAVYSSGATCW